MYCEKCGTKLAENETICPGCGYDNAGNTEITGIEPEVNLVPVPTTDQEQPDVPSEVKKPRGFSNRRKIIILIIAALVTLGTTATAITLGINYSISSRLSNALEAAQRFLSEQNYEQAILEFRAAIELDPLCVEAYLGLADAYIGLGKTDKAIEVLEEGYEKTGDELILKKLNKLKDQEQTVEPETDPGNTVGPDDPMDPEESVQTDEAIDNQTIIAASVGDMHSVALTMDGVLYTWGDNDCGQLGTGEIDANHIPKMITIDGGKKVVMVEVGMADSAAITEDGSLYTWGYNSNGELGNGTASDSYIPVEITIDGGKKVTAVSLGNYHSAAITEDGSLYTWGNNEHGQLGDGTTEERYTPTKITIDGGKKVIAVSLGGGHSAAITEDGSLYTWGWNANGQLGDGTLEDRYTPTKVETDGKKVIAVSLGEQHSAAITEDGALYMWGCNGSGRLGNNSSEDLSVPTRITIDGGKKVTFVALGSEHSAAITSDGSLYTWGNNWYGRLGFVTDYPDKAQYSPKKVTIDGGAKVVFVALGKEHSTAITENGSLYTWGYNWNGQLGTGTTTEEHEPIRITNGSAPISDNTDDSDADENNIPAEVEPYSLESFGTILDIVPISQVGGGKAGYIISGGNTVGVMDINSGELLTGADYSIVYYNDNFIAASADYESNYSPCSWDVMDSSGNIKFTLNNVYNVISATDDGRYIAYCTDCAGDPNSLERSRYDTAKLYDMHVVDSTGTEVFSAPYTYWVSAADDHIVYLCYNADSLCTETDVINQKSNVSTMLLDLTAMQTTEVSVNAGFTTDYFKSMETYGDWVIVYRFSPAGPDITMANYKTGERKLFCSVQNGITRLTGFPNGIKYGISVGRGYIFLDENFNDAFTGFTFPRDYAQYMKNGMSDSLYSSDVYPKYFDYTWVGDVMDEYTFGLVDKYTDSGERVRGIEVLNQNLEPVTALITDDHFGNLMDYIYNGCAVFMLPDSGEWISVKLSDLAQNSPVALER